ncbi:MAG: SDR family oxidoreductase [Flavobacterium sp.]|uniref:SDR family NAD(P)-dependent oxidoreductase n=1 Tax=Flavobacterium sp. TaxID=239 RepID=UPI001207B62D|nr:SDR family oxidoreductase [Flavobacterium sp.]RZJ66057.1 MAG: SDR family oxidoreductase [Flavobacterium sp.]
MFTDKTIVVTGASSGIGKAVAIHLSSLGANCVLIGRDADKLEKVRQSCKGKTLAIREDLSDFEKYTDIADRILNEFGPISGFVHSAGIDQTIALQQLRTQDLQSIFDINVFAAIQLSGIFTKKKYKAESQSIVLISSVMGIVGNKGLTSYSASKGAIVAMVRSMALELAQKGVRVNAVSPGHISDSEMAILKESRLPEEANQRIRDNHPLGLGTCDDVAFAVKFLLSDESRWITGQNLVIDGGYSIQ